MRDEALAEFMALWDESPSAARVEFLRRQLPHLEEDLVKEYSRCKVAYLPKVVLFAIANLFEGKLKPERDESAPPER